MTRLWERIRDWVLLGGLLLTSLVVLLSANEPMLRGLRARSLETTSVVEGWFSGLGRYVRALEENQQLRQQNLALSNEVARSRESVLENERLRNLLALEDSLDVRVRAARVVSKDITQERNHLILDVGSADGIEEGMAVIDASGIVGKTVLVSEHYSKVMTFMNGDFFVPARLLPSGADGMVRWDGERLDRLLLELVVLSTPVSRGDLVLTSGYSDVFHRDTPIGTVDTVLTRPGVTTWSIYVDPAVHLDRLTHVFVVLTRPDPEQMTLGPTAGL